MPAALAAAVARPLLALPFVDLHWWARHCAKVSVAPGGMSALYHLCRLKDDGRLLHVTRDDVGFMALIGSPYVISGGIHLRVAGQSTPGVNCLFLFVGAALANVMGTTGASILLIRPYLRINRR